MIQSLGWKNFIAIYEDDEGLSRLQKTLTLKRDKDEPIAIRQLNEGPDYRPILKDIRSLSVCNIIIDVDPKKLIDIIMQAREVKLFADYCNFILTYLVIHILFFCRNTKEKNNCFSTGDN